MRRTIQRGLLGLVLVVLALPPCGWAQEPAESAQQPPPTTQRTPTAEEQAQLDALKKLGEELERKEKERIERGEPPTPPARTPTRGPRRSTRTPTQTNAPADPMKTPHATPPTVRPPSEAAAPPSESKPATSIEELRARARASTQGARTPRVTDAALPADFYGPPESLSNAMAAAEPTTEPVTEREERKPLVRRPPAEDEEWFAFADTPWEDVILRFAERIGKPLLSTDDIVVSGTLTYKPDHKFTKDEAVDELNLLLHEQGYRFVEQEHHIRVIPVNEMKEWVPVKDTYATVGAFEAANPRNMDYVVVYYQVQDRPAKLYVDTFLDALPFPTEMSVLEDSNQIKIVGVARDIRRFLELKQLVNLDPKDPREITIFDIETNATDIEQRVRAFLDIRGGASAMPAMTMQRDPRTGRMMPMPAPQPTGGSAEAEVQMVADERTNTIIVKATAEKTEEIRELIKTLDQRPDIGEFKTHVVEVKHADATEVANMLNQILQQEQGQGSTRSMMTPQWQMQRQMQLMQQRNMRNRGMQGQPMMTPQQMNIGGASPEDIIGEGIFERAKKTIRLVADTRSNSLIIYANEDGLQRVNEILEIIDRPLPDTYRIFPLVNAQVQQVSGLLNELVSGLGQTAGGKSPVIVADEKHNQFYVMAERDTLSKVADLILELDVAPSELTRHIIELKHLRPSQVAGTVQQLLAAESGTVSTGGGLRSNIMRGMRGRNREGGGGPAVSSASPTTTPDYQVIPLDEAGALIVICDDESWAKVEETIQLWDDGYVSNTPVLETFPITQGNAAAIAATLAGFYRTYDHPVLGRTSVTVQAEGDAIMVYAIRPAIDEISSLIAQLDVARPIDKIEILPLVNADASTVAQQIQQVVLPRGGQRGAVANLATVQADPATNSLIVQADSADMVKIKDFALRMDQEIGKQATEKKFFAIKYQQPQEVANQIMNLFGGVRGGRGGIMATQIKAAASGSQVVVEAPHEKMLAIEQFIAQLDTGREMVTKPYKLAGADVNQIANTMSQWVRTLPPPPDRLQTTFIPDLSNEAIIVTAPADMIPKVDEQMNAYVTSVVDLTPERKFYKIQIADANYIAELLRQQIVQYVKDRKGQTVAGRISIAVDPRQNQVILNGPRFVHPVADELIKELDQSATREPKIQTITVKFASVDSVVNTLRPIFQQKSQQQRDNKSYLAVSLTPDTLTNSVIVYGGDESDHELIGREIARIDAEAQANEQPAVTITPKYADPNQIASTIQTMFRAGGGKSAQQDVQVTVVNGQLVIKAPKRKVEEIQALVAAVDEKDSEGIQVRTYDLKVLNAMQVQAQVMVFLSQLKKNAKAGQLTPGAFAEPSTNTLVVLAPPDVLPMIETIIMELERKTPPSGKAQAYDLVHARADQIANNVDAMLKAKIAEKEGSKSSTLRTAVFAEPAANRLFVYAPDEYQQLAADLISMVDAENENGELVHIVTLEYGDAQQISSSLLQVLQSRAGPPRVRMTADPSSNSILIAGMPQDVADAEKLIGDLESSGSSIPEMQIFDLKFAMALDVEDTLKQVMPPGRSPSDAITVTADEYGGRLIITANRRKMRQVEQYIDILDQDPYAAGSEGGLLKGGRQLYFVDISRGSASDIAWDVRDQFPPEEKGGPSIESDWFDEYLMVRCRPTEWPQIERVIREFERRAKIEKAVITYNPNGNSDRLLPYVAAQNPNVEVQPKSEPPADDSLFIDLWEEGEAPEQVKQKQAKEKVERENSDPPAESNVRVRGRADAGTCSEMPATAALTPRMLDDLEADILGPHGSGSAAAPVAVATPAPRLELAAHTVPAALDTPVADTASSAQHARIILTPAILEDLESELLGTGVREAELRVAAQASAPVEQQQSPVPAASVGPLLTPARLAQLEEELYLPKAPPAPATVFELAAQVTPAKPAAELPGTELGFVLTRARLDELERELTAAPPTADRVRPSPPVRAVVHSSRTAPLLEPATYTTTQDPPTQSAPPQKIPGRTLPPPPMPAQTAPSRREPPASEATPAAPSKAAEPAPARPTPPPATAPRPTAPAPSSAAPAAGTAATPSAGQSPPTATVESTAATVEDSNPSLAPGATHVPSPLEKEKVQIVPQPDGKLLILGPRDEVEDVKDTLDLLQEDLAVGEVIRIFRFKYGDVSAAAEILNIMFNERQMIIPQQPQQGQQRGRGQQGQQGQGREDEQQRNNQQQNMMDQLRGMVGGQQQGGRGQRGGQQMRIATDPGHNYLILKVDEALLPEIKQLLKHLDIPPGEVLVKIYQLKNLIASETAENIKDILGISKVQQRRTGGRTGRTGQPGAQGQQAQLMEMLQQQLVSVPGVEGGAKVERVEIVANDTTNSLLVSSPPEVLTLIEKVINELEALEGRDIVGVFHYPLENARVDELVPLLQEIFGETGGGGGGRARQALGGGGGDAPAAMGPVSVSGDPRSNTVIFTAQQKDRDKVIEQIRLLDIAGPLAEAETYICRYGDAESIATAVEAIFVAGGGRRGRGGGGDASTLGGDVRIIAEPSTNTILVWGPRDQRDLIFKKIEELDQLNNQGIREIDVVYAKADELATTLMDIFGNNGGGASPAAGGRRGRGGAAQQPGAGVLASGRLMIMGDRDAKKLLVRAPDEIFVQIENLVSTLDQPTAGLQLKRFQLYHASAVDVVESVKQAMQEYLTVDKAMGGATRFDAFTAVPDPRTNSITVVGSEETFLFVQKVIDFVDVETPSDQKQTVRVFALEKANAAVVAEAINGFASGGAAAVGGGGRGGRGGGAAVGGRQLNVSAVADESSNSVMVYGRIEDIELVETEVILAMEDTLEGRTQLATVAVKEVMPSQILSFIWQFIDQSAQQAGGRGGRGPDLNSVQIVPNDAGKSLFVRGTQRQVEEIKRLVAEFDRQDMPLDTMKVIQVPLGQDAVGLAQEVQRVVNESEKAREDLGQRPRQITIGAEPITNTLILAGDPSLFGLVEGVVAQITEIGGERKTVTRVLNLNGTSADQMLDVIESLREQRNGGGGGTMRSSGSRSGGSRSGGSRSGTSGLRRTSGGSDGGGGGAVTPPSRRSGGGSMDSPARRSGGGSPSGGAPSGGGAMPPRRSSPRGSGGGGSGGSGAGGGGPRSSIDELPKDTALLKPGRENPGRLSLNNATSPGFLPAAWVEPLERAAAESLFTLAAYHEAESDEQDPQQPAQDPPATQRRGRPRSEARPAPATRPAPERKAPRDSVSPRRAEEPRPGDARPATQPVDPRREALERAVNEAKKAALERSRGQTGATPETTPAQPPMQQRTPGGRRPAAQPPAAPPPAQEEPRVDDREQPRALSRERDRDLPPGQSPTEVDEAPAQLPGARQPPQDREALVVPPEARQSAEEVLEGISGSLRGDVSARAVGGNLIITGDEEDVRFLEEILSMMAQLPPPLIEVFPLEEANAVSLARTIEEVVETRLRAARQEEDFSITADPRSNRLIAAASENVMQLIDELVTKLDVAPEEKSTESIPLVHIRASEAAALLRPILERLARLRELEADAAPSIEPNDRSNSLLVIGAQPDIEEVQRLVESIDVEVSAAQRESFVAVDAVIVQLENAQAEDVAEVLNQMIEEQQEAAQQAGGERATRPFVKSLRLRLPDGTELPELDLERPIGLVPEPGTNSIIVFSSKKNTEALTAIIKIFDTLPLGPDTDVKVFALQFARAENVAELLNDVFENKRYLKRPSAGGGDDLPEGVLPPVPPGEAAQGLPYELVVQSDERSNMLVVVGREPAVILAAGIVEQLDKPSLALGLKPHVILLKNARAEQLAEQLNDVLEERANALGGDENAARDNAVIQPVERANALLVLASDELFGMVRELVGQLDESEKFQPVTLKLYRPKLNSAANVASLLTELVDRAQLGGEEGAVEPYIAADPVTDTLIVAASPDDLPSLNRWVEELDRPSATGQRMVIVPLQRGNAEDVAETVEQVFEGQGGGQQGGEIDLTVRADTSTNSVIAFGPPTILKDIEDLVRRIDSTESVAGTIIRIFKLDQADAEDAGELLTRILEGSGGAVGGGGGGGGGGTRADALKQVMLIYQQKNPNVGIETLKGWREDIQVISDIRTNSLVVTAPAQSMPLMESLVAAVDVPPDAAKIRVFRLYNADAEQMVEKLETLFERQTTGTGGGGGEESERVLALGEGGAIGGRQEIAFTTDVRTNSVIAAGTPGYLDLVEQLILELDTIPIKERETFVYSPRNITAAALAPSITEFSQAEQERLQEIGEDVSTAVRQGRLVTAIANEDANRLILDVDPRFRESVMRVIEELDQPPPQVLIQVLIVEVSMSNDLDLGIEWAFQDLQFTRAGPADTTTFDYVTGTDLGAAGSGLAGFTFTITGADFNFLFRTLQAEANLKVLSRPQIVAMDNQEAFIDIANDVPYVTGTGTTTGGVITTSVSRENIGISLTVTPQINPDGFVRMEIDQQVDDFSETSTVQIQPGVNSPVFFRRNARTTVMVKDNETIVLGGLITSREENSEQKVPIVGDIPGLGLLFRTQTDSADRTELLLVLTPHVIRAPEDFRRMSEMERDRLEVLPEDSLSDPLMQGLQLHADEEPLLEPAPYPPDASLYPREQPGRESAPRPQPYGPERPQRRPAEPAQSQTYDVPLSVRDGANRRG